MNYLLFFLLYLYPMFCVGQFFGTKNSKTAVTETRITETIKSCEQIEENNKNITGINITINLNTIVYF